MNDTPPEPPPPPIFGHAPIDQTVTVWARPEGIECLATLYRPRGAQGPLPVVINVHGGAWGSGYDRTHSWRMDSELAKLGLLVVAIDFRNAPLVQHPKSSADVAAAVRWVRLNAAALGADPTRIGFIGGSSGGHLAMLAGLLPNAPQHRGTAIAGPDGFSAHDEIDASVDYIVGLWPVSDPPYRFRYVKRAKMDRVIERTLDYFADEAAMWDASIPRIVLSGDTAPLPPLFVVQAGEDTHIPLEMTFHLLNVWQARGGRVEYAFYPGARHNFGEFLSAATTDVIRAVGDYIQRRLAERLDAQDDAVPAAGPPSPAEPAGTT